MADSYKLRPWTFIPSWLSTIDSQLWQNRIYENLRWQRPLVKVYGSSYVVPRKIAFLAEKNICYKYSGLVHYGIGWPDWFSPLLEKVAHACNTNFNGCLINLYRNGNDRMGMHADDEIEIDSTKPIASLSFGAARDFIFKHRNGNIREVLSLKDGDLLIMHPTCQESWLHSVPIRKNIINARINLTFRSYIKPGK